MLELNVYPQLKYCKTFPYFDFVHV